jgi:AcrR family transcriptional regulator
VDGAREALLEAAERLLARHGPARVTVTDIARDLGMSQSNVYRFFPSKRALMAGIAGRWFREVESRLDPIVADRAGQPEDRLLSYLLTLCRTKRDRHDVDPALFRAYLELAPLGAEAVAEHVARLRGQLDAILGDMGLEGDTLSRTADLIEDVTLRFRDPHCIARNRAAYTDERLFAAAKAAVFLAAGAKGMMDINAAYSTLE